MNIISIPSLIFSKLIGALVLFSSDKALEDISWSSVRERSPTMASVEGPEVTLVEPSGSGICKAQSE